MLLCLAVYLTAISLVFFIAFLGGSLAEFLTMKLVHHKTLHKKFMLGLPMICLVHIVMIYLFLSVDL